MRKSTPRAAQGKCSKRNKRNKTHKRRTIKRRSTRRTRTRRTRYMKGGNYERDATVRTTDGIATGYLHNFVVSAPGVGVRSGSAYKRLMEYRDRNGNDDYD